MTLNHKTQNESKYTTHITQGSRSEGKLKTSDNVRIDGEFIGDMEITGKLVTGEGSVIKGNVSAIDVIVGGKIEGEVKGVWSVTIQETGELRGDLVTEELIIERGAIFHGKCLMNQQSNEKGEKRALILQEA